MVLLEDAIYDKKYDEEKQLGKGSFGVVYKVKDKDNGLLYAAKRMKIRKREQKDQILEEIKILQSLTHPKILGFVGAYEKKGVRGEIILVTEYLNGGELFERIVSDDFNLTETDCAEFMKQILEAVQYLHKNSILHLDLKPENVVCVNQDSLDIKIIDFGLARKFYPGVEIRMMCGTPEYVAPEIVSYDCISPATDMWALGVLCYILISGLSPFEGETEAETYMNISYENYDFDYEEFDNISENAKDFISGLLRQDPRKRMSAEQCQSHDWLVQREGRSNVINTDNLKKFLNKRRWKRIINVRFALNTMVSKEKGDAAIKEEINARDSGADIKEEINARDSGADIKEEINARDSGIDLSESSGDEIEVNSENVSEFPTGKNEEATENVVDNGLEEIVKTNVVPQPMRVKYKSYFQVDLSVVSGKNLPKMDFTSKSDPYVKVVYNNKSSKKTKVKKNTLEPIWNEKFKMFIEKQENKKSSLIFEVYDKDLIGKEEMGRAEVDLDSYDLQKRHEVGLILEAGENQQLKKFKTLGSINVVITIQLIDIFYQA